MDNKNRFCGLLFLLLLASLSTPLTGNAQDADAVITYRKSVMQGFRVHNGAVRSIQEGVVSYSDHLLSHALSIQSLANMLSDLFPEESSTGETRALPAIWENSIGFGEKISATQSASDDFVNAIRSGNNDAIEDARSSLGQTCGSCHGDFRARPSGE